MSVYVKGVAVRTRVRGVVCVERGGGVVAVVGAGQMLQALEGALAGSICVCVGLSR